MKKQLIGLLLVLVLGLLAIVACCETRVPIVPDRVYDDETEYMIVDSMVVYSPVRGRVVTTDAMYRTYDPENKAKDNAVVPYSCANLVNRYYQTVYDITATNMYEHQVPIAGTGHFFETNNPMIGDIAYFAPQDDNPVHWAIVREVREDGVVLFEQNYKYPENTAPIGRVASADRYYRWSGREQYLAQETSSSAAKIRLQVGDVVSFGTYLPVREETESQPLRWNILEIKDDAALLLSRHLVRAMKYSDDDGVSPYSDRIATKYEYSIVRRWLNTDETIEIERDYSNQILPGFKTYFTPAEWAVIRVTAIDDGDITLGDKVFLLSKEDAENTDYFDDQASPYGTAYGGEGLNGIRYSGSYDGGRGDWWLRTKHEDRQWSVYIVSYTGQVSFNNNTKSLGVRPAIWVPLDVLTNGLTASENSSGGGSW